MYSIIDILGAFSYVGTFCLILSYTKRNEIAHTLGKGKEAEGTVIKFREDHEHAPSDMNYRGVAPVVEFRTVNGIFQHVSMTYRKTSPYEVGQTVKIYYYHYKSRRETALADDEPGTLPKTLLKWAVMLSEIGLSDIAFKIRKFVLNLIQPTSCH